MEDDLIYALVAIVALSLLEIATAIAALWYRREWKGLAKLHAMVGRGRGHMREGGDIRSSDIYPFNIPEEDEGEDLVLGKESGMCQRISPAHKQPQRIEREREAAYERVGLLSSTEIICNGEREGDSSGQVDMRLADPLRPPPSRSQSRKRTEKQISGDSDIVILDVGDAQQS